MKRCKYKKLFKISEKRKVIDRSISDELKNEDITELLCFLCYFKCGAGYEDSYTIFRALPRRKFCNDKTLSVEINNISYDKNEHITELLRFLQYFKCGAGYEDSYTIFRALPRRKICNDKTLSVEVNNISYDKNVYNMYGIDTF